MILVDSSLSWVTGLLYRLSEIKYFLRNLSVDTEKLS